MTSIGGGAFNRCSGLTSITIPNNVTSIGDWAFWYCTSLISITIPESVTSIGIGVFKECRSLASIKVEAGNATYDSRNDCNAIIETATNTLITGCMNTIIPNNVTSIGDEAFQGCTGLTFLTIPNSVTSIGDSAFLGCSGLTSITIPNSVTSIIRGTFYGCSGLTSVTIPNSVTSIGISAFLNCSSLTNVYCYAENVPETYGGAFSGSPIASATLYVPESAIEQYKKTEPWSGFGRIVSIEAEYINFADANVKAICVENWDTNGDGELSEAEAAAVTDLGTVFQENISITSFDELQYFTGLTSIGNWAFNFCSGLTSVIIPNNVTSIGSSAFHNCIGLTSVIIPNSVTSIGSDAFSSCSSITSLTISNSVTSIGTRTFSGCSSLTSVTIPNSVTSIGYEAFAYCIGLTSVTIPNSVTSIGDISFEDCIGLTSITIPNSVTTIGSGAFMGCSGLTAVTIPENMTSIGNGAFSGCSGLTSIKVEAGNSKYDSRNNCDAIIETTTNTLIAGCKNTVIPNSVTSIGESAFSGCIGLTSITIPSSVTSIGSGSFYGCSGLNSITIPNSVTSIGNWVFYGCSSLTSVTIPNSVTSIGESAFYGCSGLTSVTIPNSVTIINNNAFEYCSGLTSITIPNSVTSIGSSAFSGCRGLTSITIHNSVISISDHAFAYCHGLTDVYCYAEKVPSTYSNAFESSPIDAARLHVPKSSISSYKTISPWSRFGEILPLTYTLTYIVDGETYKTVQYEEGESIISVEAPTKKGYTFAGWTNLPETMPDHDIVVTGIFTINSYTLSYMIDGEEYSRSVVEYGAEITPLEAPTREGYTFSGWSEIPETMPAEDVVITGSFIINQYLLTYILDGEEYKSYKVDYNSTITPEPAPVKKGMTFSGWGEVPETMPACDLTLTGTYSWSKETVDGVVYQVTDTLRNYASVVGTESVIEEATILPYIEIGGDIYEVCSIAEDALPKTVTIYVSIGKLLLWLWTNGYEDIRETDSGRNLAAPEVSLVTATASSLTLFYANEYPELTETVMVSGSPVEKKQNGYKVMLRGLEPDNLYEELATLTLTYEDASYTKSFSFRTNPLTLTTEQPKVVSLGNVVVAAKSNLDDTELNVGFEWRRIDWTDDFASNYGTAYLFEGMMEGYIRNLNADKLWKYRPYYTSNAGNSYYGSWVGIDPSNTSYFLPTIHTYSRIILLGNWAEIWGYVMRGTDNITSQGFIYWNISFSSSRRNANGIPSDAKTVLSSGNVMSVTLENLEYDTEYCYMAFVTTTEGETFYGEPQTFRTDPVDPDAISPTPAVPEVEEQVYDLNGRKLNKPQKGINIIRYSDGTTRKVMIK